MKETPVRISSANYEALFYQNPLPMIVFDSAHQRILEVNAACSRLYGYSPDEFYNLRIFDLRVPEDLPGAAPLITKLKGDEEVFVETRHLTKEGKTLHVEITSYKIEYNGELRRLGQIHDVTAKVKQAQNLEILLTIGESLTGDLDLQSVLQKITDATTQLSGAEFGAFFYNTHNQTGEAMVLYTISGAPKSAFERFGMPRNTGIFHPTLVDAQIVRIGNVKTDPRYGKNAPHKGLPAGHLPVTSYMAIPVISKNKVVLGSLFFGHIEADKFDEECEKLVLAVSRQAAIALDNASLFSEKQELLKQAQEQSFKKDEFLSVASHELKTPVTSMKGYLQILEKELQKADNFVHYKLITNATTQVDKIVRLVGDLLNFSQLESGKMSYDFMHFPITDVLNDSISAINSLRPKYDIKVFGDINTLVYADKIRIEQVLINLLDNAIKYSPASSQVYVGVSNDSGCLKIEVRDFGVGIDQSKVNRVFERYYRGEENSFASSGLGLGLYISLEIIKQHQGEMGVETKAGSGSTFWFTIPLRK